ncbi:hypothetical protein F4801DRAFT_381195 [Xylaria longipes]|nr:hypothetical protein F4801DRAFT_381195 [Xylaria longipes]
MFASNRNFDPTNYTTRQRRKRARLNKHLASPTAIAKAPNLLAASPEVPTAEDISTALEGDILLEHGSEPELEPESGPKKTNDNQQIYKRANQRERQDCSSCSGAGPIYQCAECSSYQLCMNCIDFASLVHPSHVFYRATCDTSVSDTSIQATCDTPAPDSNSNVLACYSCGRTLSSLLRFACNKCGVVVCQDCQYYHPHQLEAIAGAADQRAISRPSNPSIDIDSDEEDSVGGYGAFQGDALQGNVLDDASGGDLFQDDPLDDAFGDEGSDDEGSDDEGSDAKGSDAKGSDAESDNDEGDNDSLCKSKPPTRLKAQINASKVTVEFPKPFFLAFTKAMCEMTDIMFTGKEQEVSIDIPSFPQNNTKVQKHHKLKGRPGDKGVNPKRRPWTLEDKERLCDLKGQGQPDDAIGKILGRSALAVMQQWYKQKK